MDDYSRYIIARELCKNMESTDAMQVVNKALQETELTENNRPRLLSDNGSSKILLNNNFKCEKYLLIL